MGNCSSQKSSIVKSNTASFSNKSTTSTTPSTPVEGPKLNSKVPSAYLSPEQSKTVPFNTNPGGKVLMAALRKHDWQQIQYCMNHDIGKYFRDIRHGFTPLHQFIFQRTYTTAPSKEAYEQFIKFQLHALNAVDNRNATPLHFAVWYVEQENYYVTYDLMKYGADRSLKDNEGNTPMDYAENNAFKERKSSFVIENYDSDVSLDDLISQGGSMDEEELSKKINKKKSAKLELMIGVDDIIPSIIV